jgi:predicted NAD/FAD-dependent oxidoreductase
LAVIRRRSLMAGAAACLAACQPELTWRGGWVGDAIERGHRLRERHSNTPDVQQRAGVLVVGAGIAGLAAARALMQSGVDDVAVFELHDAAGGNSRGHALAGLPCPLGAHYLPTPGPQAHEVSQWLHELGLTRHEHDRNVYDERHLCHSPQERLLFDGAWHEGLLPPADDSPNTLAQYRRFSQQVTRAQQTLGFALPTRRAPWTPEHATLDAQTFAQWLDTQGFDDARLRWYLDYCCRDDYGAPATAVSAWAGLHYFASRHGFAAPGDDDAAPQDVLTWPEGNAWLVQRLAAPLQGRLHRGCVVQRVAVQRHEAQADVWNHAAQRLERWTAQQLVLALPLFVAARILESPPAVLVQAASALRYAPWLVANLKLKHALIARPGLSSAWDSVRYGSTTLGYVNARHQNLSPSAQPTVLTAYRALTPGERGELLERPWLHWAQKVVDELTLMHADLPSACEHIDLTRHGHAMSIPAPGVRGNAALRVLAEAPNTPRLHWAHGDLAGYSVFEEAFTAGHRAGLAATSGLRRS